MQAIFESIFDIIYLFGVVFLGVIMLRNSKKNSTRKLFGAMAVILGLGDSFHLIPRMYALWTTGLEANARILGFGKFVTSISMTIFYIILYYVWRKRYNIKDRKNLTIIIWALGILRVLICLLPQNRWLDYNSSFAFGIYRNIPFLIMGIIIIVIFMQEIKNNKDEVFKNMPLAIILSFGLYIPVVLFASKFPIIGMLMIPKTLAYVWIVIMGYKLPEKI